MNKIREYNSSDWNAICEIYDLGKADEMEGVVKKDLIISLANDNTMRPYFEASQVWVFEKDMHVVAFAGLKDDVVSWLFVHPAHRRQGIARQLMNKLLSVSEASLRLNVVKSNLAAISLYLSFDFVVTKTFEGNMYGRKIPAVMLLLDREKY